MAHHRKRVYFAVMTFSGLALFVDRFLMPDGVTVPDGAAAASVSTVTASPGLPVPTPPDTPAIPELPFPRGVERYTLGAGIPDLFAPPESVRKKNSSPCEAGESGPANGSATPPTGLSQVAFTKRYRLGGVLSHERLRIAIVGGRWLSIGDEVDGCTLTGISGDAVRFTCFDGEVVLSPNCLRGAAHR